MDKNIISSRSLYEILKSSEILFGTKDFTVHVGSRNGRDTCTKKLMKIGAVPVEVSWVPFEGDMLLSVVGSGSFWNGTPASIVGDSELYDFVLLKLIEHLERYQEEGEDDES